MKYKNKEIPHEVMFVAAAKHFGFPIGAGMYEKIIKKHPEYFPTEHDRMMKWEKIPQSVHDAYWAEYWGADKELRKDEPEKGGGLFELMNNSEAAQKWNTWWNKVYWPKHEIMEKKLHAKHYSKYL